MGRYSDKYESIEDIEASSRSSSSSRAPRSPAPSRAPTSPAPLSDPLKQSKKMRSMSFYDRTATDNDLRPLLMRHPGKRTGGGTRRAYLAYILMLVLFASSLIITVRIWRGPAAVVQLGNIIHESDQGPRPSVPETAAPTAAPAEDRPQVVVEESDGRMVVSAVVAPEEVSAVPEDVTTVLERDSEPGGMPLAPLAPLPP